MIQFIDGLTPDQDGEYAVFSSSPDIAPSKVKITGGQVHLPNSDELVPAFLFALQYDIIEWIGPIAAPFMVWPPIPNLDSSHVEVGD